MRSWGLWLVLAAGCDGKHDAQTALSSARIPPRVEKVTVPPSEPAAQQQLAASTLPPASAVSPAERPPEGAEPELDLLSGPERADALPFPGTRMRPQQLLRELKTATMLGFRPVGSTSTVFRTVLKGLSFRAAFKTATYLRPYGAIAEVAAYRLSRCLGMINVPPAVLRRTTALQLQFGLEPASASKWIDIAPRLLNDASGLVEGAAIYWVDGLRDIELSTPAGRDEHLQWLSQSHPLREPPPPMAAQLSDLVAFDYLIGNWDRWSGSNVRGEASGRTLIIRDQDAAFAGLVTEGLQRKMLEPLLKTERFSRSFVNRLRGLTRASFERELGQDTSLAMRPHRGFSPRAMDGLFDRRGAVLSHVQALVEQYGEQNVLVFP